MKKLLLLSFILSFSTWFVQASSTGTITNSSRSAITIAFYDANDRAINFTPTSVATGQSTAILANTQKITVNAGTPAANVLTKVLLSPNASYIVNFVNNVWTLTAAATNFTITNSSTQTILVVF